MQAIPDDGLWKVRKRSERFCYIHPTWNQDTYQETWKDLNKITYTKCVYII